MVFYKRPKFWFALVIAEVAAFILSALISIVGWVCLRGFGVSTDNASEFTNPIGLLAFVILG